MFIFILFFPFFLLSLLPTFSNTPPLPAAGTTPAANTPSSQHDTHQAATNTTDTFQQGQTQQQTQTAAPHEYPLICRITAYLINSLYFTNHTQLTAIFAFIFYYIIKDVS